MTIEDYSYLQGEEEEEGEDQDGGMWGYPKKTVKDVKKKLEKQEARDLQEANPVNIPGLGRRAGVATISGVRKFGKNASALAISGVSGASSMAQDTAAFAAKAATATAAATAKAPSKLVSTVAATVLPPKSEKDLINERKFININLNEMATRFETDFKSELSDLVVKFFTVSDHTNSFEFSKIKVLKKLSSIKLYHTKLCLKQIFAELKTCNAYLFQSPPPDQSTPKAAIEQFKDKIQSVVEANFKDDFFNDNIAIHISNNNYLALQQNLNNYLFKDKNSNDYSITNLHQKSILLYILQLFVIYYYPKYLLEIICKVMVENVTVISESINALMNNGNLNNKLSELVASLVSESEKAAALRRASQRGGVGPDDPVDAPFVGPDDPVDAPFVGPTDSRVLEDQTTYQDKRKVKQLSNDQIKQLVFDKYIKGIDLQDQYNKKSRKVFYNALVNFAISIRLDITRNNYTSEIITKLEEFSDSSLILSEKAMNDDIALIDTQIRDLDLASKISAQVQLIEGPPGTRLTRDALFDKYYAATTQDNEKKNIRRKILNTTSVEYPIYVEFQKLERFKAELVNMENKKNTYKRINEVKRNMFDIDNILEIKDDIWLDRGTPGDNYHDALYNLIMTAAEQSLMFLLNEKEVTLDRLDPLPVPLPVPTPKPPPGPRNGPWLAVFPPVDNPAKIEDFDSYEEDRLTAAAILRDKAMKEADNTNLLETIRDKIKKLEAKIRELEEKRKKAPTDSSIEAANVQVDLDVAVRNTREDLKKAKEELAAALSPPLAAPVPVPDAAANAAAPDDAAVPVPVPVPGANTGANIIGAALSWLGNQGNQGNQNPPQNLSPNPANPLTLARVRAASDDAALTAGGKRRTRRHKKRAGTRRYKKRAGTRRHKKRSGTHKKRKNRTR